jgi:hypothetical protein
MIEGPFLLITLADGERTVAHSAPDSYIERCLAGTGATFQPCSKGQAVCINNYLNASDSENREFLRLKALKAAFRATIKPEGPLMTKPHKHAAIIKAWADGAAIQYKYADTSWLDVLAPTWKDDAEYRIKPANAVTYCAVNSAGHVRECCDSRDNVLETLSGHWWILRVEIDLVNMAVVATLEAP